MPQTSALSTYPTHNSAVASPWKCVGPAPGPQGLPCPPKPQSPGAKISLHLGQSVLSQPCPSPSGLGLVLSLCTVLQDHLVSLENSQHLQLVLEGSTVGTDPPPTFHHSQYPHPLTTTTQSCCHHPGLSETLLMLTPGMPAFFPPPGTGMYGIDYRQLTAKLFGIL